MQVELENYQPTPQQLAFHASPAKFRFLCTGVGFGKTAAGVNELIRWAFTHQACLYAMIAPTLPMLRNSTLREFFKFCPKELIKDYNKAEHKITLANNAEIIALSGDNERDIDRLRGSNLGGAYGDEIAICPEYMHDILVGRLRDARGPMKIIYSSTPKGFNYLHRIFVEKKNKEEQPFTNPDEYAIFTGTSLDNPYTDQEYKRTLQETYAGVFAKQEIYGEFVGYEGLVYPHFNRNAHVTNKPFEQLGIKRWIAGVDWGFTNPSVILAIGIDGDDRLYVIEEFYEKRVDHNGLKEVALQLKHKYNIQAFYCDPSEPMFIQSFNNAGIRAIEAVNDVMPGIKEVASRLAIAGDGKPRLFVHERCVNLINEFQQYRYPEKKENKPVDEQPLKIMDHALDSLRYAVMSLRLNKPVYRIF